MNSIGQLRSVQIINDNKIEKMNDAFKYEQNLINTNIVFEDPYAFLREDDGITERNFKNEEVYYVVFSIKQNLQTELNINIALVNGTSSSKEKQIIKNIKMKRGNEENNFEIIFQPRFNDYEKLFFILERTNEDYIGRPRKIELKNCKIYKVINLMDKMETDIDYISEIGIQAREGSLFSLNGEGIRIGRNGVYELHFDGIKITQIGVIEQESLKKGNNFIIDYKYVTK